MFKINPPPAGTTVTADPTTHELAAKSNNVVSRVRYSLNGRRLIATVNGVAVEYTDIRKAVCDVYPAGTNSEVDNQIDRGGAGHPPQ